MKALALAKRREWEAFGAGLAPIIEKHVAAAISAATAPLLRRIEELEARAPIPGRDGRDGINGRDGERGEPGPRGERGEKGEQGEQGERGERGDPGEPGKDGEPGERGERGEPGANGDKGERGETGPRGEQGERGAPGDCGERGEPGENGRDGADADMAAILRHVDDEVAKHVAALPPPERGEKGERGEPGEKGEQGEPGVRGERGEKGDQGDVGPKGADGIGEKGEPGERGPAGPAGDAVGINEAVIDKDGALILTLTNGKTLKPGCVVGRDGSDGADGRDGKDGADGAPGERGLDGSDGLGFEDLHIEQVSEREVKLVFARGDQVKEFPIALPGVVYRGVWTDGAYVRGDAVTFGGSLFIAQEDTSEKPEASKAWRLAVKRGKDGARGERGKDGANGRDGKDWRPPGLDGVLS